MTELDQIICKALNEAERRISERQNDVVLREVKEARMQIRKEIIDFIISLQEVLRKVEEAKASMQTYTNIPEGKGDRKTLGDIVSEHRERKKSKQNDS